MNHKLRFGRGETAAIVVGMVLALSLLAASSALAKVTLPSGKTIPDPALSCYSGKPGGLSAIFACACTQSGVCNIGAACPGGSTSCDPGTYGTCETTIWHSVNDNTCIPSNQKGLDPVQDAAVKPETFKPVCGLTFSLLARGGALFKNGFGWYNVVPGQKPPSSDLHLLVDCNTQPGTKTSFTLLNNAAYKGGEIGFFLVTPESATQKGTCAKGDCCATVARATAGEGYIYYSEPKHNPDNTGPGSYIHLLLYGSKIDPHTFYFAWEDTFAGTSTDYADFVTGVSGISCAGAGVKCDTGKPGICGLGVSKCNADGALTCAGSYQAEAEACDGLDNDCDGTVDNGATCTGGKVCYLGSCVGHCANDSEFPCQPGFECQSTTGLCLDKACKNTVCKAGEICRFGTCGNGCDGVVCPKGQVCQSGACVDPCTGRTCKSGEICKLGVCLPTCTTCGGVTCTGTMSCDTASGDCYDPSCSPACKSGTYCLSGKCVDHCYGVKCPGSMLCSGGRCPPVGVGKSQKAPDGGIPWSGDGAAPGGDAYDPGPGFMVEEGGCGCRVADPPPSGSALVALAVALVCVALAFGRRRR